ncbi:hypothetical protein FPV67DRAFT_874304 [Lyophyllum atratum]|nr:hypothetical protein FPV67DRAFT_874304 [Lyophyllum atratum]
MAPYSNDPSYLHYLAWYTTSPSSNNSSRSNPSTGPPVNYFLRENPWNGTYAVNGSVLQARDPRTLAPLPNRPGPPSPSYAGQGDRHWRSDLNNIAKKFRLKLAYEETCHGPPHDCHWVATAYIGEVPYGTGQSRARGDARELASKVAVEALEAQGYIV